MKREEEDDSSIMKNEEKLSCRKCHTRSWRRETVTLTLMDKYCTVNMRGTNFEQGYRSLGVCNTDYFHVQALLRLNYF